MAGNIQQYTSPIDQLHPSDEGDKALARAGSLEDMYAKQAGTEVSGAVKGIGEQVKQHEELSDITEGGAALAAMTNNLHTQWQEMATKADPNDKTIQGTFLDNNLEPTLEKFQDGFQTEAGQKWALQRVDELRNHFYDTTAADMATRAGNAVKYNLTTQANELAGVAHKNPASVDQALSQIDATVQAVKDNHAGQFGVKELDALDNMSADMKGNVVKSAVQGIADKNPQLALQTLNSNVYDKFLSGKDQEELRRYANMASFTKTIENQQKKEAAKEQEYQATEKANASYIANTASGKPPLASQVVSDENMTTDLKALWIGKDGILSQPTAMLNSPSYGTNFAQAVRGIYSGHSYEAVGLATGMKNQEFTPAGAAVLQKLSAMTQTPEGVAELNAQKKVLDDALANVIRGRPYVNDPTGQANYDKFLNAFYPAWEQARKGNVSINDLTDPKSPNYAGNLARHYTRSDAQTIADVTKVTQSSDGDMGVPSAKDIQYLRSNPDKAAAFNKRFGADASKYYMNKENDD